MISVVKQLRGTKKLQWIKEKDCTELINLSFEALLERISFTKEELIKSLYGKEPSLLENKLLFIIDTQLRLLEVIQEQEIDFKDSRKFKDLITDFVSVLNSIICINLLIAGKYHKEVNILLDQVASESLSIWKKYKKIEEIHIPEIKY